MALMLYLPDNVIRAEVLKRLSHRVEQTFWSTDQATYGAGTVYFSNMSYGLGYSSDKGGIQVKRGLSVRCVKD